MAAVPIPLLFAALTGRSGHGLAPYGPRCPTYSLGLLAPAINCCLKPVDKATMNANCDDLTLEEEL